LAYTRLIEWKKQNIKDAFIANNLDFDVDEEWQKAVPNPDDDPTIQEHLTIWKLAFGITFLCLKIEAIKEEYFELIGSKTTWAG
jgi:hypothetical protein